MIATQFLDWGSTQTARGYWLLFMAFPLSVSPFLDTNYLLLNFSWFRHKVLAHPPGKMNVRSWCFIVAEKVCKRNAAPKNDVSLFYDFFHVFFFFQTFFFLSSPPAGVRVTSPKAVLTVYRAVWAGPDPHRRLVVSDGWTTVSCASAFSKLGVQSPNNKVDDTLASATTGWSVVIIQPVLDSEHGERTFFLPTLTPFPPNSFWIRYSPFSSILIHL